MNSWDIVCADVMQWGEEYDGPPFHACLTDPPYHLTSADPRDGGDGAEALAQVAAEAGGAQVVMGII